MKRPPNHPTRAPRRRIVERTINASTGRITMELLSCGHAIAHMGETAHDQYVAAKLRGCRKCLALQLRAARDEPAR